MMDKLMPPPYLRFDAATRRLRLDPHEESFAQNPYEAYAWLHSRGSMFFWEDFGFWCAGGFDEVSRLLRDRRFGRQNPAGVPDSRGIGQDRSHLAAFDAIEANSMLELEPPAHTRLRTLVNRAFVSRQVERLRPRVESLANELIDRFEPDGETDLLPAFGRAGSDYGFEWESVTPRFAGTVALDDEGRTLLRFGAGQSACYRDRRRVPLWRPRSSVSSVHS